MFSFYKMCTVYKTQNGLFKIHENDYIIYKWVVNGYVFEHNLINKYLQGYIKDFKYIVDAGANIGCHAISYAGFNPSAIIYAFEPQKELYNIYVTICSDHIQYQQWKKYNDSLWIFSSMRKKNTKGLARKILADIKLFKEGLEMFSMFQKI